MKLDREEAFSNLLPLIEEVIRNRKRDDIEKIGENYLLYRNYHVFFDSPIAGWTEQIDPNPRTYYVLDDTGAASFIRGHYYNCVDELKALIDHWMDTDRKPARLKPN